MAYGTEDTATTKVEEQTSKAPSLLFLGLALGSMAASAALVLTGRKQLGTFIGQWAPTILIMGTYNKIAKELRGNPQQQAFAMPMR
ncbi:MAG: hypothetical protein ACJ79R_04945 [Anaeromyxobacteraceae bacterium]